MDAKRAKTKAGAGEEAGACDGEEARDDRRGRGAREIGSGHDKLACFLLRGVDSFPLGIYGHVFMYAWVIAKEFIMFSGLCRQTAHGMVIAVYNLAMWECTVWLLQ